MQRSDDRCRSAIRSYRSPSHGDSLLLAPCAIGSRRPEGGGAAPSSDPVDAAGAADAAAAGPSAEGAFLTILSWASGETRSAPSTTMRSPGLSPSETNQLSPCQS